MAYYEIDKKHAVEQQMTAEEMLREDQLLEDELLLAEYLCEHAPEPATREDPPPYKLYCRVLGLILLTIAFVVFYEIGIHIVNVHCAKHLEDKAYALEELVEAEHIISEAAHTLAGRGECNETVILFGSTADPVSAPGSSPVTAPSATYPPRTPAFASLSIPVPTSGDPVSAMQVFSPVAAAGAVTVPVSTYTALSTVYAVSFPETTRLTSTTVITIWDAASSETPVSECLATETVTVTVTASPLDCQSLPEDATVTGNPNTVTELDTDLSYTSGYPDATVSGNPQTVTDVLTDVSITTGLPDATISGNPQTVTDVQSDYSLSSTLPDATVSGDASTVTDVQASFTTKVISDLWDPLSSFDADVTTVMTTPVTHVEILTSLITYTVTEGYSPPEPSSDLESSLAKGEGASTTTPEVDLITRTVVVTKTAGDPVYSTTIVEVPYPGGGDNDTTIFSSGTVGSYPSPPTTTPAVIVSGGNKRHLEGHGKGAKLGLSVLLVALFMFTL